MFLRNQFDGLSFPNVKVSIPSKSKSMPEAIIQKLGYLEVTTCMLKFRPFEL